MNDISSNGIQQILTQRILVLDGAMGTMVQHYKLEEKDFRGEFFKDHKLLLKGNIDVLVLSQPEIISAIHREYLDAGADIIETCTFNANRISQADYGLESRVFEINYTAAKIAKEVALAFSGQTPEKPRFVAGSIGPTNKMLSMSPDVNNPGYRDLTFDQMADAYYEQVAGLVEGGVDILLVETVFDTLTAKAALFAIRKYCREKNIVLPIMVSGTISDNSSRTLSGQTAEAFLVSIAHVDLLSIGLNCAFGPRQIRPYLEALSKSAPFYISVHPNAGLPDQFGHYHESPEMMAEVIKGFIDDGFVNIIGGCCGTTPAHIRKIGEIVKGAKPREVLKRSHITCLSGLESLKISRESNFVNIGERTNVAGSKKFAHLIREKKYEEALSIAQQQVESGAQILDVNMDDAMLDGKKEMTAFLNMLASDPGISKVPIMIDSSDFQVLEAGLKCLQGKAVVNSISLKEGEDIFIERARKIKDYGAAVIVMAFDEQGQAVTYERRTGICERAYKLLTTQAGFHPEDIIFDCNILTIATGMEEHNNFAVDFINAIKWIKNNLPYAKTSGGVSNLSYSFLGNDTLREAMHAVFLFHAIKAGLDMGIVNAGALPRYDEIDRTLLELLEDVVLNRRSNATERLLEYSATMAKSLVKECGKPEWRNLDAGERIRYGLLNGVGDFIEQDLESILSSYQRPLDIIEGPLMQSMNEVVDLFGEGKMFLPQLVKSARVMKKAFTFLKPFIEAEKSQSGYPSSAGKVLLATVNGDVHDIGKNIAGVILSCNNYEVIDLGVMVPPEKIVAAVLEQQPDIIGLSGLITPSLEEMITVVKDLRRENIKIPVLIGGAATSKVHTAVKIQPNYDQTVVHVRDASKVAGVIASLVSPDGKENFMMNIKSEYAGIREDYQKEKAEQASKSDNIHQVYKAINSLI